MSPPSPAMSENRAELRKSNKPLMEKKRRARINASLSQLKGLVLEAMKKDTSRYSKLEKADILDMTVKHLKALHRQQMTVAMTNDPTVMNKYHAGFNECAKEVTRYMNTVSSVEPDVKARLLSHLGACLQQPQSQPQSTSHPMQPLRIQIPPVSMAQLQQRDAMQSVVNSTPTFLIQSPEIPNMNTLQLIPGTLPNGDVAYFVPNNRNIGQGQMQMSRPELNPVSLTSAMSAPYARQTQHMRTPSAGSEAPSTSSSPSSLCSSPPTLCHDIQTSPINLQRYPQTATASSGHSRAMFKPIPTIAVKQEDPVWRPW